MSYPSSSSPVWMLWRTGTGAGHDGWVPVEQLWTAAGTRAPAVHNRDRAAARSRRPPRAVHRLSTAVSTSGRRLLDPVGELGDLVEQRAPFGHLLPDLPVGVHDRGVVPAAERLPDARQRQLGELAAQVHRDLPGVDQYPGAGVPPQVLQGHAE